MTVNRTTLPQFVNLFPIFFVFVLLAWTYASYILWSFQLLHTNLYPTISCLVIYHFFLVMMITSYVKCIITDPGTVPSVYLEKVEHLRNLILLVFSHCERKSKGFFAIRCRYVQKVWSEET